LLPVKLKTGWAKEIEKVNSPNTRIPKLF